jgi:hypothetical protein
LRIAAERTDGVSSVPAFLTEHLRRRLWKKDKREVEREAAERTGATVQAVDASKCLDCGGSNFYYPGGYEEGSPSADTTNLAGWNDTAEAATSISFQNE